MGYIYVEDGGARVTPKLWVMDRVRRSGMGSSLITGATQGKVMSLKYTSETPEYLGLETKDHFFVYYTADRTWDHTHMLKRHCAEPLSQHIKDICF